MSETRDGSPQILEEFRRLGRSDSIDPRALEDSSRRLLPALLGACEPDIAGACRTCARSLEALAESLRSPRHGERVGASLDFGALEDMGRRVLDCLDAVDGGVLTDSHRLAWQWLDVVRHTPVARRIADSGRREEWLALIVDIAEASRFTVGRLLAMRVAAYGPRTFLRVPSQGDGGRHSWLEVAADVDRVAKGLLALEEGNAAGRIAILSENRYEMAICDLACLTTGLVNVMVPAHATDTDAAHILGMLDVRTVILSSESQLEKVLAHRASLPALRRIVTFFEPRGRIDGAMSLGDLVRGGAHVSEARLEERRLDVELDDLATIMVTSGTTGKPKGIRFTQRCLISKRFARGLALPEIGDRDVFLCYLPLFHTFGRYLELLGTLFWGATYIFMEDHSREGLVRSFAQFEPSVLISIPMKWLQLQEEIARRADLEAASDEEIERASRQVLGQNLRWGLSAAGYLPAETFRFFQRQGVELMSGFGMTEATGGITMTPPGAYRDDTLGVALPGIELKLDDDGELMMRGPYVTPGYVTDDGSTGLEEGGWLRTGDLMRLDEAGYYQIVDRKKEIYKNIKGETIAPQRVENLFRDFEAVARVFLVGDHREYNTLLIVPNPDEATNSLAHMGEEERKAHFRSLVVSVNSFLAPFERIVDFAVLERDFSADRGELTPKNTYRRKSIEKNFAETIEELYRRTRLRFDRAGVELLIPNWVYQVLGLTARDVRQDGDTLLRPETGARIRVERVGEEDDAALLRIGSCVYRVRDRHLDLGTMLGAPSLWLGNEDLVELFGVNGSTGIRSRRAPGGVERISRAAAYVPQGEEGRRLRGLLAGEEATLSDLHLAGKMLGARDERLSLSAVRFLEQVVARDDVNLADCARVLLRGAFAAGSAVIRQRALLALLPAETPTHASTSVRRFLGGEENILDDATIGRLSQSSLPSAVLEAITDELWRQHRQMTPAVAAPERRERLDALMVLIAGYGAAHPAVYKRLRWALARVEAFATRAEDAEAARRARGRMQEGFRRWLGPPSRIAVDSETGEEYGWEDVITFEEEMIEEDRHRLLGLIRGTSFILEAVFLFSGRRIQLSDVPRGGIWISLIAERRGKAVYRVTVHTRFQGSYDIAVNLNRSLSSEQVAEEILWLLAAGEERDGNRLVEDFGGYWRQYDLWSEEFVAGETIERFLRRLGRQRSEDAQKRLQDIWPFIVWNAAEAYLDFWDRTGRRFIISDPANANVIVPTHDFQVGPRIVSVTARMACTSLAASLLRVWRDFVLPMEKTIECLRGIAQPELLFSALLEVVGRQEGLRLLESEIHGLPRELGERARAAIDQVRELGFIPKRLHFAIQRYHRWRALSTEATPQARARMVRDLYETYNVASLLDTYPAARVRFFRETVLRSAPKALRDGLDRVMDELRRRPIEGDELIELISSLRQYVTPESDEEYFLTRLTYPHLRPGDRAELFYTEAGGTRQADVLVVLPDHEGNSFRVRHPVNPKEVGRLHRLFLQAKLEVTFRPEHEYLVAVNERGDLIGGLFFEVDDTERRAHLEKIVVVERLRKLGISDGLMGELFSRLRARGIQAVTTGFFRPSYFYRFGFTIEKGYAGLVKDLLVGGDLTDD